MVKKSSSWVKYHVVNVYPPNSLIARVILWRKIIIMMDDNLGYPWVVVGDFNSHYGRRRNLKVL